MHHWLGSGFRWAVFYSFVVAGASGAQAADTDFADSFGVTADHFEYIEHGKIYIGSGGVRLLQGDRALYADWAAFSVETRRGVASGHVRMVDSQQKVEGRFLLFDLDTLDAVIFKGSIDFGAGDFLIKGDELEKDGDRNYRFKKSVITSCRCPEEEDRKPWVVVSDTANVELGGYGLARNSTINILGVPVLWLPWILFPAKTERESGLLPPEFAVGGKAGTRVGVPIFWAARHDVGLIFTPQYLANRGFKGDLDVQYLVGEKSGGEFYSAYGRDDSDAPQEEGIGRNRWALMAEHEQFLPWQWHGGVDVKLISDSDYLSDYDEYSVYRRELFLNSEVFIDRRFGNQGRVGALAGMTYAQDIDSKPRDNRDDTILNRWPEASVRVLGGSSGPLDALGILTAMDTQYIYFRAAEPQQAVRGEQNGSRLIAQPRIARPFALGRYADFLPEVGYGQTVY